MRIKLPIVSALAVFALSVTIACNDTESQALTGIDDPAFVHEANSRAEITGPGVSGHAIVNFTGATGNTQTVWRSSVNVRGLAPGDYDFYVTPPPGPAEQLVCSFTVRTNGGRQGCSANTNVPGFGVAEIRTSGGMVVASGTFERRGGNRF